MRSVLWASGLALLAGCEPPAPLRDASVSNDAASIDAFVSGDDAAAIDAGSSDAPSGGPTGVRCVESFPYRDDGDTTGFTGSAFDVYACGPIADEGGPER